MENKKIIVKPINVKKDTPVPEDYTIEKNTENGVEIVLTPKAELEIKKRLSKDG